MPILLKRSFTTGSIPTTASLSAGELAINVTDGKVFVRQSGSLGNTIRSIPVMDVSSTGSLTITGSVIVTGSLTGTNIILPTTASNAPRTGSMFYSASFIYVYDGSQYRSASLV